MELPVLERINQQPVEKADYQEDGSLEVVDCWRTIQGEGPFAGTPALFLRTAACNLDCPACDTDYTTGRQRYSVSHILNLLSAADAGHGTKLVVITGGEPFRQNLSPLVRRLLDLYYDVQVETNGTLCPDDVWQWAGPGEDPIVTIVCCPKTGKINDKLKPHVHALKYVVAHGKTDPQDGLPTDSLGAGVAVQRPWPGFGGEVFVQPLDEGDPEKNKLHLQEAVNSCLKHGYRLCIQTHKLAGLP